jgi:O-acetyl-ADP-ribose deacetylase
VGPVWHGGTHGEGDRLASCYEKSLALAKEHNLFSIAFPSISTGVYAFPPQLAAPIALKTVRECTRGSNQFEVTFCCFSARDLALYSSLLAE